MEQYTRRYLIESLESGNTNLDIIKNGPWMDFLCKDRKKALFEYLLFEFDIELTKNKIVYHQLHMIYIKIKHLVYKQETVYVEDMEKSKFEIDKKIILDKFSKLLFNELDEDDDSLIFYLFDKEYDGSILTLLRTELTYNEQVSLINVLINIADGIRYLFRSFPYIFALYELRTNMKVPYFIAKTGITNLQYTCIKYIVDKHKNKIELISNVLPQESMKDINSYIHYGPY